ncbi:MAG: hypothetical protein MRZ79_03295 [Bacteroidia bacterium]|nr:hypothetical protein [Bacteroidia bacterium]
MSQTLKTYIGILLLSLFWKNGVSQYTQSGIITLQNSGKKAVEGAEIGAPPWGKTTVTDSKGDFELIFSGKGAGYESFLKVRKPGYEVVNKEALFHTLTVEGEGLSLYMCKEGEWQKNAILYYGINEKNLTRRYEAKIASLRVKMSGEQSSLTDSLKGLQAKYEAALSQAKTLAQKFATTNLDDVSDLYNEAFALFREGKIAASIEVLNEDALDEQYRRIQKEIKDGKEWITIGEEKKAIGKDALESGIKNYLLRAELLTIDLRFDEADRAYRKAVDADTSRWETAVTYAQFLNGQGRHEEAVIQNKKGLRSTEKWFEKALSLNGLGISYFELGEFGLAKEEFEKAIDCFGEKAEFLFFSPGKTHVGFIHIYTTALGNLSSCYLIENNLGKAKELMKEVIKISGLLEVKPGMVQLSTKTDLSILYPSANFFNYFQLGELFLLSNQPDSAILYSNKGLAYVDQLMAFNSYQYEPKKALYYDLLGKAHLSRRNLNEAKNSFEIAVRLTRELEEKNPGVHGLSLAQSLTNLGTVYLQMNVHDSVLSLCLEAKKIYEEIDVTGVEIQGKSRVYECLGTVYNAQKKFGLGLEQYLKAIELIEDSNTEKKGRYLAYYGKLKINIGWSYFELKKYEESSRIIKEGINILRPISMGQNGLVNSSLLLGYEILAVIAHNDYAPKEAEFALLKADSIIKQTPSAPNSKQEKRYLQRNKYGVSLDIRHFLQDNYIAKYISIKKNYFTYITATKFKTLKKETDLKELINQQKVIAAGFEKYSGKYLQEKAYRHAMSDIYGTLAWYQLLDRNYEAALEAANVSTKLEPLMNTALLVKMHLNFIEKDPNTYFSSYISMAYMPPLIKDYSWGKIIINDLEELDSRGLIPEDRKHYISQIKQIIKQKKP